MDAIIVNRVSDAHQREGYSLEEQEYQGKRYAEEKDFNVLETFTFQESASKSSQRKKFGEIIAFIMAYEKGISLAVVVEKHDRLYRNHTDKNHFQLFVDEGTIQLHFYKEGKVLTKDSPPSDVLVDDVMTSVNQYTARNIGRETKKGMLAKAREGWIPRKAPFGYINVHPEQRDDKNRRRGIVKPTEWGDELIPRMYGLRIDGFSLKMIRNTVIEEGLVPADHVARFHVSKVEKILKSSFYMGEFVWAGKRFEGKHRPLVLKSLWEAVQQTFISKADPKYRVSKRRGSLSGFMECKCGCRITYDPKEKPSGRRYEYYRCANGRGSHKKLKYVSEGQIFKQFAPAIDSISISKKMGKDIAKALNETAGKARRAHQCYIESLLARQREMEGAEDQLYDDYRRGVLDESAYKRQVRRVRDERERLTKIVGEAHTEVTDAAIVTAKKILELAERAPELYLRQTPEKRRKFLEKLLSNPVLDGVTLRYELKRPFRILSEMTSSPAWGG